MEYKVGSIVFGNWQIVRLLGEGANGKVYEIHRTDYGVTTKSALKVIRIPPSEGEIRAALNDGMDEQSVTSYFQGFVQEIIKEVAVMSELKSHSGIVAYEDHKVVVHEETIGWDILIRMELLTSMQEYLASHKMDEAEVIRLGKEICSALEFCQKKALIHRDIKPENIFVNESGQFKLGDFGIARTVEKTTGGLSKKGTESYMAPEVYRGQPYGSTVDIYSLGLVLYKLMNHGRLPLFPPAPQPILFEDRENALNQRMEGKIFAAPEVAGEEFGKIILKACSYNPKERYHTAAEMGAALDALTMKDSSQQIYDFQKDEDDEGTQGMWDTSINPDDEKTEGTVYQWESNNEQTVSDIEEKKSCYKGKLLLSNGERYEGEYFQEELAGERKNIFSGIGTYYFKSGMRYEGEWQNGKPHGYGCMYDVNGQVTIGKWEDGTYVRTQTEPKKYVDRGETLSATEPKKKFEKKLQDVKVDNKVYKRGKLQFPNGENYDGEYVEEEIRGEKKNTLSGMGSYYFQDGSKYEGQWKNDKPHGDGRMYDAKGRVTVGKWERGSFVSVRNNGTYVYKDEKLSEELENEKNLEKSEGVQTTVDTKKIVQEKGTLKEKDWLKIIRIAVISSVFLLILIGVLKSCGDESAKGAKLNDIYESENEYDAETNVNESEDMPEERVRQKITPVEAAPHMYELGKTWESGTVRINGKVIALPCEFSELEEAGLNIGEYGSISEDTVVKSGQIKTIDFAVAHWDKIEIDIINPYETSKKINECLVGQIYVEGDDLGHEINFPGEIQIGSSIKNVIQAYGNPQISYEGGIKRNYNVYRWQSSDVFNKECEIWNDSETGKVVKITLKMYDTELVE